MTVDLGPGQLDYVLREPLGVTVHIAPWNYPLVIFCRSVAPALAAGNTCVVKPAEDISLVTLAKVPHVTFSQSRYINYCHCLLLHATDGIDVLNSIKYVAIKPTRACATVSDKLGKHSIADVTSLLWNLLIG